MTFDLLHHIHAGHLPEMPRDANPELAMAIKACLCTDPTQRAVPEDVALQVRRRGGGGG